MASDHPLKPTVRAVAFDYFFPGVCDPKSYHSERPQPGDPAKFLLLYAGRKAEERCRGESHTGQDIPQDFKGRRIRSRAEEEGAHKRTTDKRLRDKGKKAWKEAGRQR